MTAIKLNTSTPSMPVLALLVGGGLVVVAFVLSRLLNLRSGKNARLPPGPKPHFLFGNDLPTMYPWRAFYEMSKKYGPLVTVWKGRAPTVICSDVETAEYFLEKNARDTTDRPRMVVLEKAVSYQKRILTVGHNQHWRTMRKALHNPLQPSSSREIRPVQERLARHVITDILENPARFQDHINTYAASLVVHMAYGREDRARYSDDDIREVCRISERIGILHRPGSFKAESFPILRHVPGYLSTVHQWAQEESDLFHRALAVARAKHVKGELPQCFASYMLENQTKLDITDAQLAYLLGAIFAAGSDTSSSAITIIVMASAVYQAAQKRVQAELDEIAGSTAAPTFEDLDPELAPVLHAFIYESFRWRPVSSGGFAHRTTAPIEYQGYVVPAGTVINGNHWAIHRDESYYGPDVENFDIDRWLTTDAEGKTILKSKMKHYQFGFGRRVCPGQYIAMNSLLINTALLLWSFDIRKKKDAAGNDIDIDTLAFSNHANSHPLPFKADLIPRKAGLKEAMITDE